MATITIKTKPIIANKRLMKTRTRMIASNEWRTTKQAIQLEIQSQWKGNIIQDKSVCVNILFYFGDNRRRDIDAYIKIILDSMEGIVYDNDLLIDELHVYKQKDLDNPRTEVMIV